MSGIARDQLTQEQLKALLNYDPETGIFVWKHLGKNKIAGSLRKDGYIEIRIKKTLFLAHRLAFLYVHDRWPEKQTDHINHKRNDNAIGNLREVTNAENHRNRPMQKNNTSGCVGVHWSEQRQKWFAQIKTNGKMRFLGYFATKDAARTARIEAEVRFGFDKNHGLPSTITQEHTIELNLIF